MKAGSQFQTEHNQYQTQPVSIFTFYYFFQIICEISPLQAIINHINSVCCVCVHACMHACLPLCVHAEVCFDCALVRCFVMGHMLQFGEVARKRVHHFY